VGWRGPRIAHLRAIQTLGLVAEPRDATSHVLNKFSNSFYGGALGPVVLLAGAGDPATLDKLEVRRHDRADTAVRAPATRWVTGANEGSVGTPSAEGWPLGSPTSSSRLRFFSIFRVRFSGQDLKNLLEELEKVPRHEVRLFSFSGFTGCSRETAQVCQGCVPGWGCLVRLASLRDGYLGQPTPQPSHNPKGGFGLLSSGSIEHLPSGGWLIRLDIFSSRSGKSFGRDHPVRNNAAVRNFPYDLRSVRIGQFDGGPMSRIRLGTA